VGTLGENDCPTAVGELEPVLKKATSSGALVGAAEGTAQLGERLGPLELRLRRGQHVDRLAQELDALVTALDEPGGAKCDTDRTWRSPAAGKLDLLPHEATGFLAIAKTVHHEGTIGAQRGVARVANAEGLHVLAGREEIGEPLLHLAAGNAEPRAGSSRTDIW
jgi:hypothetical protein